MGVKNRVEILCSGRQRMCVCVCERERERERIETQGVETQRIRKT